jgi:radical SAM superfamily enzyme YgiQ (UPF0313 family)
MNIQFVNIASFLKLLQNNIPYASGCLISSCLKNPDIKDNFNFREIWWRRKNIEKYAAEFKDVDILCVTNYMWNKDYNDVLAAAYKEINPEGKVVYGGVEVPEEQEKADTYIKQRPFVDVCFVGQSEKNFQQLLLKPASDWNEIDNTFSRNWYNVSNLKNAHMSFDIPTPYIDGVFDNLVGRRDSPTNCALETNRGCPYSCSFCDWGLSTRSKIKKFDLDSVYETIDWIWHPANKMNLCLIIDANFGIFDRDLEILEKMIEAKEKYKNKIDVGMSGLVKNNKAEFHTIIEKVNSNLSYTNFPHLKVGVQTHSEKALIASDRWNIKDNVMFDIFQNSKYPVHTELIVGLPEETPDSWLDTLQKEFEIGVSYSRGYSLSVLPNAPLAKKDYIEKYGIKLKTILIPIEFHNMNKFTSILDPDRITKCKFETKLEYYTENKVYECNSYTNDELVLMYQYQWWYQLFFNSRTLYHEIKASPKKLKQQVLDYFDNLDNMPLLKQITDRYRNSIAYALKPEEMTKITRYRDFNNIDSSFKCDETKILYDNREIAAHELRSLYPHLDFSDWINPYDPTKPYYQGMGDSLRDV